MSWHEFIFSEKKPQRYFRHIAFWLTWWVYFLTTLNFLPKQTNAPQRIEFSFQSFSDIVHSALIVLIHVLACYVFIYFLLPRFLLRAKYLLFMAGIILLGFAIVQATRFIDTAVVTLTSEPADFKVPFYTSVFTGLISSLKIIAAAAAIKLVKHWWVKQKEKERLDKERIETELKLLKSQIHPSFLFNTLNNIYSLALRTSPKAPEMLLKLSDILSYMLYECNELEVPLEKEIKMLKDYMSLEKLRHGDKMEMNMQVKGDISNSMIAPLLLLRFIENSFKQCDHRLTEQPWINLEIEIKNHILYMKLMNGKPVEIPPPEDGEVDDLALAQRRLELLYPGRHELKIAGEPGIMMISLEIHLKKPVITKEYLKQTDMVEEIEA